MLPLLNTLLGYQIQHAPVSFRLRLLRWYTWNCLLNSPTSLNSAFGCSLMLMFYTLTSAWYPCCIPYPPCGVATCSFYWDKLSGTFSKFPHVLHKGHHTILSCNGVSACLMEPFTWCATWAGHTLCTSLYTIPTLVCFRTKVVKPDRRLWCRNSHHIVVSPFRPFWWASSVVPDDCYVNTLFQFVNTYLLCVIQGFEPWTSVLRERCSTTELYHTHFLVTITGLIAPVK